MTGITLAPAGNPGSPQIIPNFGPHTQFYVEQEMITTLVMFGMIYYDKDYGPNANVYRPVVPCDENTVRGWFE